MYLDMLLNKIDPSMKEKLGNDPLLLEQHLHSQQDRTFPHKRAPIRQYLSLQYSGQWIGRGGPMPNHMT